ncbi:BREX-1 system adenine-specific DNA-methyltransferase PglX [Heliobacterium undosum]|uniref:site-specific DNA-methyltransferase (adenine-specific) n=1 Tax=Heliomicrobium undosum TaxID=121734 RepID=A0A845L3Q6_9FIRM|nr:BREX-1 system adenine-specific DNA-methyltransferase PglX [Heliomicrobium undosum]MZP29240.1 BREX-1 system adenine-specific DNA-methyltransferase PglX [Heliomicrobium undosum]
MNRGALKNFAVRARAELVRLIAQAAQRSGAADADATGAGAPDADAPNAVVAKTEAPHAEAPHADASTVETVAYTWFIRLSALRFMEARGYLGLRLGEQGDEPAVLRRRMIELCRSLQPVTELFADPGPPWTERWLPEAIWEKEGVARRLYGEIPEEDFRHVEVLGWLHQFYWAEKKDEVFTRPAAHKIAEADIPAATQLFTPHWIVRFMVENSLGRLCAQWERQGRWTSRWRYYLPGEGEAGQPLDRTKQPGARIPGARMLESRTPESIRLLDPACGSGHILVYAFDLLADLYESRGIPPEDYVPIILEKNLAGLDVDERAARLAAFALLMKARERTPLVFQQPPRVRVFPLQETKGMDVRAIARRLAGTDAAGEGEGVGESVEGKPCEGKPGQGERGPEELASLLSLFAEASHFGSLLRPEKVDFDYWEQRLDVIERERQDGWGDEKTVKGDAPPPGDAPPGDADLLRVRQALRQARMLTETYDVVITNPPYMGIRNMNSELRRFVRDHYPRTKGDLFAAFMERMESLVAEGGYHVTVTMQSWMFLTTYEEYRRHLLREYGIVAMVHMANMVMGIAFGTVATVLRKGDPKAAGTFVHVAPDDLEGEAPRSFPPTGKQYLHRGGEAFLAIAGSPIAYWVPEAVRAVFAKNPPLRRLAEPKQGLATADNDRFLRLWHEVNVADIGFDLPGPEAALASGRRWIPYNKGGRYRKWYGNQEYVIDWAGDGEAVRRHAPSVIRNRDWYFREGITWSFVSSSKFGVRYTPPGFIFDVGGSSLFPKDHDRLFLLAFLCSKLSFYLMRVLNPTLNFQVGNIAALPIPDCPPEDRRRQAIERLAEENVRLARRDWDDRENSWRFDAHPFLTYRQGAATLEAAFSRWQEEAEKRFEQMRANEEGINALLLQMYGLAEEMSPSVSEDDITLVRADRERDARTFLSYAVGCILGRYSPDRPGLIYAGGVYDEGEYGPFRPVPDGILPIDDQQGGADDVVAPLRSFLAYVFGEETVEENLKWLADALRRKGGETAEERLRRYFRSEFYGDHIRAYRKRPIYWLFASSPSRAFQAIVYLHRLGPDTLERLRSDHLAPRLAAVQSGPVAEEMMAYARQFTELARKEIEISLDDGVLRNYGRLRPLLAEFA